MAAKKASSKLVIKEFYTPYDREIILTKVYHSWNCCGRVLVLNKTEKNYIVSDYLSGLRIYDDKNKEKAISEGSRLFRKGMKKVKNKQEYWDKINEINGEDFMDGYKSVFSLVVASSGNRRKGVLLALKHLNVSTTLLDVIEFADNDKTKND